MKKQKNRKEYIRTKDEIEWNERKEIKWKMMKEELLKFLITLERQYSHNFEFCGGLHKQKFYPWSEPSSFIYRLPFVFVRVTYAQEGWLPLLLMSPQCIDPFLDSRNIFIQNPTTPSIPMSVEPFFIHWSLSNPFNVLTFPDSMDFPATVDKYKGEKLLRDKQPCNPVFISQLKKHGCVRFF